MSKQQAFKAVTKVPAYQLVEESIRGMIMGGELSPGDLLPPETELAVQLEVTRPTVREAFRSLEGAGLLKRGPRRRMVVTAPSPRIVHNAMHEAIMLHGVTYRELWEINMALEPTAAALAASKITPELLDEIEANLARTAECLDNPAKLVECDVEFHELIAKAADNHALLLAKEPLGELFFPAYGTVISNIGPGERLFEAHTKIFQALKKGNEKQAQIWMTKHIRDFLRGCELAGVNIDAPVNSNV
ncbi:HTH-type transcriptional repressor NanR [Zhongshania aliphaticivorans]|uniref:HTH-type transcriptional repressor NanR n=1 Tax=Zhongshania aliphaticivorans TaxID=1470434 RepID=A0A5S9NRB1_9GAMM|nr:FadR/GntR family transcriptional regulator [Zhongshania aliphaticivorans]CAA0093022.1 HTH-type transcriptional repressor NanR [Zhongshania aliphaticivorans]CAA0110740.1 HTH-type transcriptional repressor NanR [Zhongshania aliphaticivorans]